VLSCGYVRQVLCISHRERVFIISKKRVLRRVFGPRRRREMKRTGRKMHDEHEHGSHSRLQMLELRNLLFKKLSLGSSKLSSQRNVLFFV
jgi:hypothetical protein